MNIDTAFINGYNTGMRQFIRVFTNFFIRPFPFIKRHLWYSLLVLVVNFTFYAGLILLVNRLFEVIWIENIFLRITEKSILLRPLYLLNQVSGNPLLNIMQPLMLYLSYSLAFALSTIITGPILGLLSRSVERDIGYASLFPKRRGGIKNFFIDLKEELFMLALTICWTAVLFSIALIPDSGVIISLILFYLITPLFHGGYNLSYFFMRKGLPYSAIYKRGFRSPSSFYGFSLASASGFFLILLLLKVVPYGNFTFVILFGLNALFRPFGVISGTLTGISYSKGSEQKLSLRKGIFASVLTGVAFVGATVVLFTAAQFYSHSQSKLDLIDCQYKLQEARLNLPSDFSDKSFAQKLLGIRSFLNDASFRLSLRVINPTKKDIYLEDFKFELALSGKMFGNGKISGFKLEPGTDKTVKFLLKLSGEEFGYSMVLSLINKKRLKLSMRGWISLNLWFGKLSYPVILIK